MLSLYIHIPFCAHKCSYCSFFVLPEDGETLTSGDLETMKEQYLQALLIENKTRQDQFPQEKIKTIYIGGGTPFQLWAHRLFTLIDELLQTRDCEFLEELTIELNPDPFDEVLEFIEQAWKKYKDLYRLRFSLWIQSFDDEILKESKRNYSFDSLIDFFRSLLAIKTLNMVFNGDFIAFWKHNVAEDWSPILWSVEKQQFFLKLIQSSLFDSFSLYTLELFPGSDWRNEQKHIAKAQQKKRWNDEQIMEEFHLLRNFFEHSWYKRYEISNFANRGKQSIHNLIYREWASYIWIGINASSFLNKKTLSSLSSPINSLWTIEDWNAGIRFKNTHQWKTYLSILSKDNENSDWLVIDGKSLEPLTPDDRRWEEAILSLRTSGIKDVMSYEDLYVDWWEELLTQRHDEQIVAFDWQSLKLESIWFDLYNAIITQLFK